MDLPSLETLMESGSDPRKLHAALVHIPIAAGLLGAVLVIGLSLFARRSGGYRWCCVALFLLASAGAFYAMRVGEQAAEAAGEHTLSPLSRQVLHEHEEMGEKVWLLLAGTAVLVALTAAPLPLVRSLFMVLAVVAALFTAGWVVVTGYHGGTLVYDRGVGVPATMDNLRPPVQTRATPSDDEDTPRRQPGTFFGIPTR